MKRLFASFAASTALAAPLSVVNAQQFPAVTGSSSAPVMVKTGASDNGRWQMKKMDCSNPPFLNDVDVECTNPAQRGIIVPRDPFSIPNLNHKEYATALNEIDPRLSAALIPPSQQLAQGQTAAARNFAFILAGPVSTGNIGGGPLGIGGTAFEREFMQRYQDTPGTGKGMTMNVERVTVKKQEDLKMLQDKGLVSKNAEWAGEGKYMARAFAAQSDNSQVSLFRVDPYAYVQLDKAHVEARGGVFDKGAEDTYKRALAQFDPQTAFNLPRELNAQVVSSPQNTTPFDVNSVAENRISNSQPGGQVVPGVTIDQRGVTVNPGAILQQIFKPR